MCFELSDDSDRYRIERSRYFQSVGKLLPHRISTVTQDTLGDVKIFEKRDFTKPKSHAEYIIIDVK